MYFELEKLIKAFGYEGREENGRLIWLRKGIAINMMEIVSATINQASIIIEMKDETVVLTKDKIEIFL